MAKWHHAPVHHLCEAGAYMVTAGTHGKEPLFTGAERLALLQERLLELAVDFELRLQAWAVFVNHYHWVAEVPGDASRLREFIRRLHSTTARELNARDATPGRRVWFQ